MSWYFDFKPSKAIETDQGIKAKSKRGDFVKNWWASRWLQAMERVMDSGRLQRGRSYARKGQVLSLEEKKGQISARVQGSRPTPYKVSIELTAFTEQQWAQVLTALEERPYFVAQLLAGEMPQDIEEAFHAAKLDVFPGRKELQQSCSCPDWAEVCKHLAAVHYILAERFDEDPFLLFRLRGKSQADILDAIGRDAQAGETATLPEYSPGPPLAQSIQSYWQAGPELERLSIHIAPPEEPYPLLERLGQPDFWPEANSWLAKAYDQVSAAALHTAYPAEESGETN